MNINSFVQQISILVKKKCKLTFDLENGVKVTKIKLTLQIVPKVHCASLVGIKPKVEEIYQF